MTVMSSWKWRRIPFSIFFKSEYLISRFFAASWRAARTNLFAIPWSSQRNNVKKSVWRFLCIVNDKNGRILSNLQLLGSWKLSPPQLHQSVVPRDHLMQRWGINLGVWALVSGSMVLQSLLVVSKERGSQIVGILDPGWTRVSLNIHRQ